MAYNKEQVISVAKELVGDALDKQELRVAYEAIVAAVEKGLSEGEDVNLRGFVSFKIADVAEREFKNPQTGETSVIPAHKTVRAKVSKTLKEAVG